MYTFNHSHSDDGDVCLAGVRKSARRPRIESLEGHYLSELTKSPVAIVSVGAHQTYEYKATDSVVASAKVGAFVDLGSGDPLVIGHNSTGTMAESTVMATVGFEGDNIEVSKSDSSLAIQGGSVAKKPSTANPGEANPGAEHAGTALIAIVVGCGGTGKTMFQGLKDQGPIDLSMPDAIFDGNFAGTSTINAACVTRSGAVDSAAFSITAGDHSVACGDTITVIYQR